MWFSTVLSDLLAADLVDVEADRLALRAISAGPPPTVTVSLPDPVTSRAEFLTVPGCVLADARAAALAEPLTSLEAKVAERPRGAHGH